LGYRWLNSDRSWMYGLNAGYDTRPMATGAADSGVSLFGSEKTVFFPQAAVNLEAISNSWNFNAYALLPTGDKVQQINWLYQAGSLEAYGVDVGYNITPDLSASIGYYYQDGDGSEADGSGVLGRVAYEVTNGLTAGVKISYDEAFDTRVSADLKVRFGGPSTTKLREEVQQLPVINALASTPRNRDVRIHDSEPSSVVCFVTEHYTNAPNPEKDHVECHDGSEFFVTANQLDFLSHAEILRKGWVQFVIANGIAK
jgi:hypothetical protein